MLETDITTGDGNFREWPEVSAVVIDIGSGRGFVTIAGGGEILIISTGDSPVAGQPEFVLHHIQEGQSCIVHGSATVIFVRSLLQNQRV